MKFIVVRKNFKDGLDIVERAAGDGAHLPILRNILIEAGENKIIFIATNLDIGMQCAISAKVIERGRVTVPAALTSNIVGNLPQERLNFEKKGVDVLIKTDNYEAVVKGLPAEEFPLIPKIKNEDAFLRLKGAVLKEALGRVIVATQPSDFKPELNSVLFDFSLDTLKCVATDNFRLAEKTIPSGLFETHAKEAFKILVPLKSCGEVLKMVKDDDDVTLSHDVNQVRFATDHAELISRLIDATFPDYTPIIPKELSTEVTLDREEFISAIRLAGVFGGKTSEARLRVSRSKKALELSSGEQAVGENKYTLAAKIQGADLEASFNWHHLLDGLRALKDEHIYFGMNEDNKPAILKSPKEISYFYLLAPLYPKSA